MTVRLLPPLAVGSLLIAGCSLITNPLLNPLPSGAALAAELRGAQQRWAEKAVDSYQLTLQRSCFCSLRDEIRVTVEDGRVSAVTTIDGGAVDPQDVQGYPLLVESAFRTVQDNLGADAIDVVFDPEFGFPAHVGVNPHDEMDDEEFSFDITDFVAGT